MDEGLPLWFYGALAFAYITVVIATWALLRRK
jgi:hypothetical protein